MTRWFQSISKAFVEEKTYLYVLMAVCLLTPCAYMAYLNMSALMLNASMMDLLVNSSVESVHLITNISALYSAYAIYQHAKQATKASYLAMGILLLAQGFLMNWFILVMLLYYAIHYIGWKNISQTYHNADTKQNLKAMCSALLVLIVGILTFFMKVQLGMLF